MINSTTLTLPTSPRRTPGAARTRGRTPLLAAVAALCLFFCAAPRAHASNCCPADWNNSGGLANVADIFAYLSDWFNGNGDFDEDGVTNVSDIFKFLSAWFTPCQLPCYWGDALPSDPDEAEPAMPGGRRASDASLRQHGVLLGYSPVHLFSGEVMYSAVDITIPLRGADGGWVRRYRSQLGTPTTMGNNWTHCYDIFITVSGNDRVVHNGWGRADTYKLQPNGTWACRGYFRVLSINPDQSYTLTFDDTGKWNFRPFSVGAGGGYISQLVDCSGQPVEFYYDASGRLVQIIDSLGRALSLAYTAPAPEGHIASVIDYTGRTCTYGYDAAGNLVSATGPAVTGTPNGNDFPLGKTTTYTYSSSPIPQLSGNLLTVTDAAGHLRHTFQYSPVTDPTNRMFDRCVASVIAPGDPRECTQISSIPVHTPLPDPYVEVRAITTDGRGLVKEFFYGHHNELLAADEYTGFATPCTPSTDTDNRPAPGSKLRATDPDFFHSTWTYNSDLLVLRATRPKGGYTTWVRDSANPDPRLRARTLSVTSNPGPVGADQPQLVDTFTYAAGSPFGDGFPNSHTDPRGFTTQYTYDARGNPTHVQPPIAAAAHDFEYNLRGQMTAHVWPDNGSGHVRRDEFTYYTSGPQNGYLYTAIVDAAPGGLALSTTFERDARGNPTRIIDPRGNDTLITVNQLDQVVQTESPTLPGPPPYRLLSNAFYDNDDHVIRLDRINRDAAGTLQPNSVFSTLFTYDDRNLCTSVSREIDASTNAVTQYTYDADGHLISILLPEAVAGNQPSNTIQFTPDERGLLFTVHRTNTQPTLAITDQYDYDPDGHLNRAQYGIELVPQLWFWTSDGYGRTTNMTDPMGNVCEYHYDPAGNLGGNASEGATPIPNPFGVRVMGELNDVPGSANNVRLYQDNYGYDDMGRPIQHRVEWFDPATQAAIGVGFATTTTTWTPASMPAVFTDANNRAYVAQYDGALRQISLTDPLGNVFAESYDANGSVIAWSTHEVSDLGNPAQDFITTLTLDSLERQTAFSDNAGQTSTYGYDSRGNLTSFTDPRGILHGSAYDGLGNRTSFGVDMNANLMWDDPQDIVAHHAFDLDSRTTSSTDANGNVTRYAYDALGRPIVTLHADGTIDQNGIGATWPLAAQTPNLAGFTSGFDPRGVLIDHTDANSTRIHNTVDLLGRTTARTITRAPGVLGPAAETYQHTGLGQLALAQNDFSRITHAFDSMGNLTRDSSNLGAPSFAPGFERTFLNQFDAAGNPTRVTYPGGRVVVSTFDALNRAKIVRDDPPSPTSAIATNFYIGNRLERTDYGNGTRLDLSYDNLAREARRALTFVPTGATLSDHSYGWDPAGQPTSDIVPPAAGGPNDRFYAFNAANRLVSSQKIVGNQPPVATIYALDKMGNRLSTQSPPAAPGIYVMQNSVPPIPPSDFQMNQYTQTPFDFRQYDSNGSMTSNFGPLGNKTLAFDWRGGLAQFTADSGTVVYRADCFGRRVEKTAGGVITRFYYIGDACAEEQNSANATTATYITDTPSPVDGDAHGTHTSMTRSGQKYFLHPDYLGSVERVTNTAGATVEKYDYADFGAPSFFNGAGSPIGASIFPNPHLWLDSRWDSESGYYQGRSCSSSAASDPGSGGVDPTDDQTLWGCNAYDPSVGRTLGRRKLLSGEQTYLECAATDPFNANPVTPRYCVQYRESDFNFVSRLMEEEGIFYSIPPRHTPPVNAAVVVGPGGEEIFTDKYSRVKVQFHWDREGKSDDNSACWSRITGPFDGDMSNTKCSLASFTGSASGQTKEKDHKDHKDWIDVSSFCPSAGNAGAHSSGGGGGAGKVSFSDFHFGHHSDTASTSLFKHCCVGKHIPEGIITVRKAGDKPTEYLKYKFTDIMISYQIVSGRGVGDPIPTDSISFVYGKIKWDYTEQQDKRK